MRSPHHPIREHRVPVAPGRCLGVAELGDPAGFPVLWFHGTPGGRLQLPPGAPAAAAQRGLRLFGVERPGTGDSTPHRYAAVRDFSADAGALASALGLGRFAVAGLSGGGPYALACAHDLPDRIVAAVVIAGFAPVLGPDAAPGRSPWLARAHPLAALVAGPLGRALPAMIRPLVPHAALALRAFAAVAPATERPHLLDPALGSVLVGDILHVMDGGVGAMPHDFRLLTQDWGFLLRDVRVPVRFFHGDADGFVPLDHARHQAGRVQRGALTILPGGHLAGYADASRVFDAILPFVPARQQGAG